MPIKIFAAVVTVALVLTYLSPVVFKLKNVALSVIIVIGVVMMLIDLWQSLKGKEE
jgi:hypothetical protein